MNENRVICFCKRALHFIKLRTNKITAVLLLYDSNLICRGKHIQQLQFFGISVADQESEIVSLRAAAYPGSGEEHPDPRKSLTCLNLIYPPAVFEDMLKPGGRAELTTSLL